MNQMEGTEHRIDSREDSEPGLDEPSSMGIGSKRNGYEYFSTNAQGAQGSQMKKEESKEAAGTLKLVKNQNSEELVTSPTGGADHELGFPQAM